MAREGLKRDKSPLTVQDENMPKINDGLFDFDRK